MQSHKAILRDHLRAYRKHGIGASVATEGLRYAYRVVQGVLYRFGVVI